jgi:transcriptional antiterminator NusG
MTDLTDDGDDRDEQALEDDDAVSDVADTPDIASFLSTAAPDDAASDGADTSDDAEAVSGGDIVITEDELLGGSADEYEHVDEEPVRESPYDRPGSWYVVHTYAGY